MTQAAVDGTRCVLMANDTDYPEPVYSVRPLSDVMGIALVLAPERGAQSIVQLQVAVTGEAADHFQDAALERLRRTIPAARGLPLLRAIAQGGAGRVVLDYLDDSRLAVEISPC